MDDPTRRLPAALALALAIGVGAVLTTAAPASAHGLGGLRPTNYETRVLRVTPRERGIVVRSVDLGTKLELTNRAGRDVVVLGYEGEPYLRVGPRGRFENRRSPALYLNRTTRGTTKVPATADAHAPPQWHRIGGGRTVRWHDHRAHWMGTGDPPVVDRNRGSTHLIQRWRVELVEGDTRIRVLGDVRWVPGPSPWPWVLGAVALAVALAMWSRARRWGRTVAVGLVALVAASTVHVVGLWGGSTASSASRLAASTYELGGMVLGVVALGTLARRGSAAAAPLALITGLFLFLAGGLADVTTLSRSQVPTTLAPWVDRLAVAVTLGAGAGLTIAAALRLRPGARPRPRRPVRKPGPDALEAMRRRQELVT